jgi:hypothetical protein
MDDDVDLLTSVPEMPSRKHCKHGQRLQNGSESVNHERIGLLGGVESCLE